MTPVPDQGKPMNCGRLHLTFLKKELPINEALCRFDAYSEEFIRDINWLVNSYTHPRCLILEV